jgi:CheY-like chemotaxis protein
MSTPPITDTSPPSAEGGAQPLANRVVLLVEDLADSLTLMAQVLELAGAEVHEALNAEDALALLDEGLSPDLIVSDIGMPGMSGYELMESIRARPLRPQPPAVAITAYGRRNDRLRALRAGFQAHLSKPADAEEMVATLVSLATLSPE